MARGKGERTDHFGTNSSMNFLTNPIWRFFYLFLFFEIKTEILKHWTNSDPWLNHPRI